MFPDSICLDIDLEDKIKEELLGFIVVCDDNYKTIIISDNKKGLIGGWYCAVTLESN